MHGNLSRKPESNDTIVLLDPGHGGDDTGATGNGLVESVYVLELARLLAFRVAVMYTNLVVGLTRSGSDEMTIAERGAMSRKVHADLVVSLHVNAYSSSTLHGALAFVMPGCRESTEAARAMLRAMPDPLRSRHDAFMADTGPALDDSWLQKPRNVLRPHTCAAVLLEVGYCSNATDAEALRNPFIQSGICNAVMCGIDRFRYLTQQQSRRLV